ncbi:EamA family transporter [Nitratireductor sp. CAU 1489]|uniref:EamA family transporter n=1 Tax=Nitratireductor arenosus TaxID=2682096 RepID=A0A844QGM8_9HYPH|nr:DMT family transporter [Nitratireductor arenosus]MVA97774.1 EamA family transporter [Nitratireductor arenosus]
MHLSPNLSGALTMAIAMAAFTVNDAVVKLVSTELNMGQIMLVRGIVATLLVALLAWRAGVANKLSGIRNPMVLLRVAAEIGATVSFLLALQRLPLANVTAVLQVLPLAVTMGAALVFAEPVGWRRWSAILAGFAGVLIIIRPGFEGFSAFSLLALLAVMFCTVRDLATRRIHADVPTLLVSTLSAVGVTIIGGLLVVPLGGWKPLDGGQFGTLAVAAVMVLVGYQCVIVSMRSGDISFVAPYRYTGLLWALVLGYAIFGDVPDAAMIAGAVIVVGSGLFTLYREQVRGPRKPAAESTGPTMSPDGL